MRVCARVCVCLCSGAGDFNAVAARRVRVGVPPRAVAEPGAAREKRMEREMEPKVQLAEEKPRELKKEAERGKKD